MNHKLTFTEKYSYSIIIGVVFFIVAFLVFGCSARNVTKEDKEKKEVVETKVKAIDTSKTTKKDTTHLVIVDSSNVDEIIITPIDSTKEMVINGKKYKNAKISHKKEKRNKTIEFKRKIEHTKQKAIVFEDNSIKSISENQKTKLIVKPQFNWGLFILQFWWLWLIILLALYLGYRYYKGVNPFTWVLKLLKK